MPKNSSIHDVNIFIPIKSGANANTMYVSIISVFIIFSLIVYLKPELFLSIFNSLLGNIILFGLVLGLSFYHVKSAIAIGLFFFMLVLVVRSSNIQKITDLDKKEKFTTIGATGTAGKTGASASAGATGASASAGATGASANAGATGASASASAGASASASAGASAGSTGAGASADATVDSVVPTTSYASNRVTKWPSTLVSEFLTFQKGLNPDVVYDMSIVQNQATPDEVAYLFKNYKWPWSDKLQELYKEAIAQNSFIYIDPDISMINAQQIYNETAMKELISYNTKEGTFLLFGATIGHTKDLPSNINNYIQCSTNAEGEHILEKIVYNGYDSIYGNLNKTVTEVNYNELPNQVNGFTFLGSPCNPCVALKTNPEYTCPFAINSGNGYEVSPIWQMLWNITPESVQSLNAKTISSDSSSTFPILSQLKNEMSQLDFISQMKTNTGVSSNGGSSATGASTGSTTSASNASSVSKK